MTELELNTVCQSACCPNLGECFSRGTATFLILGDVCTRGCHFCAVKRGYPDHLDIDESRRISVAAKILGLSYVVITSVTRDDLPDGGASRFAITLEAILSENPQMKTEVLIPDFQGSLNALNSVLQASPDVVAHNLETVQRLYPKIRPGASYQRSLDILRCIKTISPKTLTKSGLMLGLGEKSTEVVEAMRHLREANCDFLTLGQYLSPSSRHYGVVSFIPPHEFDKYAHVAKEMRFRGVASGPWVRSSFHASEMYQEAMAENAAIPAGLKCPTEL